MCDVIGATKDRMRAKSFSNWTHVSYRTDTVERGALTVQTVKRHDVVESVDDGAALIALVQLEPTVF